MNVDLTTRKLMFYATTAEPLLSYASDAVGRCLACDVNAALPCFEHIREWIALIASAGDHQVCNPEAVNEPGACEGRKL